MSRAPSTSKISSTPQSDESASARTLPAATRRSAKQSGSDPHFPPPTRHGLLRHQYPPASQCCRRQRVLSQDCNWIAPPLTAIGLRHHPPSCWRNVEHAPNRPRTLLHVATRQEVGHDFSLRRISF